ncbi:MAG: hypothetical protein ACLQHS_04150 [Candidatus Limnocylindrales bacterium]
MHGAPMGAAQPSGSAERPPARRLSRMERVGLLVQGALDKHLTPVAVWLYRRTKGRITRPWKVDALLLTSLPAYDARDGHFDRCAGRGSPRSLPGTCSTFPPAPGYDRQGALIGRGQGSLPVAARAGATDWESLHYHGGALSVDRPRVAAGGHRRCGR